MPPSSSTTTGAPAPARASVAERALRPESQRRKSKVSAARLQELRHEIDVLRRVDHPNIVHLREAFWEAKRLVLVMELCEGTMLSALAGRVGEACVASCAEQLLRAVAYLHSHEIVHRDLKLDNIMALGEAARAVAGAPSGGAKYDEELSVTLIDFGLSRLRRITLKDEPAQKVAAAGTLSTAAPEVVRGGEYSPAADVWSCGASLYRLIAVEDPFLHDHVDADAAAIQKLEAAAIPWLPAAVFAAATKEGKKFLYNCMRAKLTSRWSSAEATKFALRTWLPAARLSRDGEAEVSGGSAASWSPESPTTSLARLRVAAPMLRRQSSEPFTPRSPAAQTLELSTSMRKYASYSDLKRAALIVAAHQTDHRHAESLRLAFNALDTTATGGVRVGDLRDALRDHVRDSEIELLFEKLDHDRSGVVHYHEFLAATMESRPDLLDDEVLRDAFDRLDSDDTGCISEDNLTKILGKSASTANVRQMIADGDFKKNGSIDFDEFTMLMRQPSAPPPTRREEPAEDARPRGASFGITF